MKKIEMKKIIFKKLFLNFRSIFVSEVNIFEIKVNILKSKKFKETFFK